MSDRFPLILNTSTNQIQEIASGDTLDLTGNNIKGVGIITATTISGTLSGIATLARGLTDIPSINVTNLTGVGATFSKDLDVDGHTNLDNVSISGVVTATTFAGSGASLTGIANANVASNAAIVGTKISPNFGSQNIVTTGDFNSGSVTITGGSPAITFTDSNNDPDYYIQNNNGALRIFDVTNNAERFVVNTDGHIDVAGNLDVGAGIDVTGNSTFVNDIDVDGHTNLDNVSIAGVTTIGGQFTVNANNNGANVRFVNDTHNAKFYIISEGLNKNSQIFFGDAADDDIGSIDYDHANNSLLFVTNTSTRMTIDGSGTVNIPGNLDVGAGVDVTGNATVSGNLSVGGVLTYEDVTNVDSVGIVTARSGVHLPDTKEVRLGGNFASADARIYHNGADLYIDNDTGGTWIGVDSGSTFGVGNGPAASPRSLRAVTGAQVDLYYNTGLKLSTTSTGANIQNSGDAVLQVTTSGTSSTDDARLELITQESSFIIQNDRSLGTDGALTIGDGTKTYFQATKDGSVELFENGNKVLETNSLGVTIGDNVGLSINGGTGNRTGTDAALYVDKTNNNDWCAKFKTNVGSSNDYGLRIECNNNATFPLVVNDGSANQFRVNGNGNVYANEFHGDGSNLTGISIGITTEQVTPSSNVATLNLAKDDHKIVASGTYTIDVSGGTEAGTHTLRIENSGTANVGFSSYFMFPSGGTPSLPTTSGSISLISFQVHKVGSVGIATVLLAGASVNFS